LSGGFRGGSSKFEWADGYSTITNSYSPGSGLWYSELIEAFKGKWLEIIAVSAYAAFSRCLTDNWTPQYAKK